MNEQSDSLDELMRRRVQDAVAPPPPHVWPAVERALRRRRQRFIFWFALLGLFAAGAVGYWAGASPSEKQEHKAGPQPAERPLATSQPKQTEAAPTGLMEYQQQPISANAERQAQQTDFSQSRSSAMPGIQSTAGGRVPGRERSVLQPAFSDDKADKFAIPQGAGVKPSESAAESLPADPSADEVPGLAPQEKALLVQSLPSVPGHDLPIADRPLGPLPKASIILPKKKKDQKSCYDFEEHPNVWFADAYIGPGLANRTLSTSDPEFLNYKRQRSETEQEDLAFNTGLRASLLLHRHYLLRTGLHYDQFVEVFENADPNFVEYTVKVRSELINGIWQTVTDTVGVEYGEHYQKTFNRYGMLDIPIMLGGEWRHGRTGFSVQAGATVNVLFWKRGSMLSTQGAPVHFEDNSPTFRARTGASLMGSVQWFWHVQPRLRVFVEPYYRQILRPVTLDQHPVRQQYGILGLQFGFTKILD